MIHLFWATCRPLMMRQTYYHWMDNAVNPDNVRLHVAVDKEEDLQYLTDFEEVRLVSNPNGGVVRPVYELTKNFEGEPDDIMIVPSDDFYAPKNWDTYLIETLTGYRHVLKVNDGHMDDIISIPIMKYSAFKAMNKIIYHPAYSHMFCDKELHDTANELGICLSVDKTHPLFDHRHPHYHTRNPDEHDKRNGDGYQDGRKIYEDRRYMNLKERMEV